jgi:hypothetical protein
MDLHQDLNGAPTRKSSERREAALLRILIASGEKTLEAFETSDNSVDSDFVADLRRIIDRSRNELVALQPS